jgi:hypothetical protein
VPTEESSCSQDEKSIPVIKPPLDPFERQVMWLLLIIMLFNVFTFVWGIYDRSRHP